MPVGAERKPETHTAQDAPWADLLLQVPCFYARDTRVRAVFML